MNFIELAIKKYVGTFLIFGMLAVLGLLAVTSLPVSYYPEFSVPVAFVQTAYPGAGPESVESEVTKPLEEAISGISGLDQIQSTSREGFSLIQVSYSFGVDIAEKKRELQEKLDQAKPFLPREAKAPVTITINDFLAPPIELAVTSKTRTLGELKLLVEKRIAPALTRLKGVAAAKVTGGADLVVKIEADPLALRQAGLNLSQLAAAVASGNTDFPIGDISGAANSFTLRLAGKYQAVEDVRRLYLSTAQGKPIRLGDIAKVALVQKTQARFARLNGRETVGILVRKPSGGNSILVAAGVKQWLRENRSSLPEDIRIEMVSDESVVIGQAINSVALSLFLGALLAVVIIFLFLGSIRNTLVIALSIPVTVVVTFLLMRVFNLSWNTISLGGLGLAVGMVVDAAIVVMENTFRHLKEGDLPGSRLEVAVASTRQVALAISASTLTTIVVFLPLAFTQGLAQVLLGELSLVVVFALALSIIVAVTLVPVLSYFLIRIEYKPSLLSQWFQQAEQAFREKLVKLLSWALAHRWTTVSGFALAAVLALLLAGLLPTGLLPNSDQGQFQVTLDYPLGTPVSYTDGQVQKLESWLSAQPSVRAVSTIVGEDPLFGAVQPYHAVINVFTDRTRPTLELMSQTRRRLSDLPGAASLVRIIDATAGVDRNDVDVSIIGQDLDTLRMLGDRLARALRAEPGMVNIKSNLQRGLPAYVFIPDRQKLSAAGLNPLILAQLLRAGKSGQVATTLRQGDLDIDLEVSFLGAETAGLAQMESYPVATPFSGTVPLKALGTFREGESPAEINRINQRRTASVTGEFTPGANKRKLAARLDRIISGLNLPREYQAEKRGAQRAIAQSFGTLGIALLISVFLVYIVIGVQFNSFIIPFIITLSIPFSFPGAVAGLLVSGQALNLPSFLGIIMLGGIVVNNGIILLDFIIENRRRGQERNSSIREAVRVRFRPIMMTTLTTILGMLFLALDIGGGGEALSPLANAVMGGLSYSLLVSLILVPVVYTLLDDLMCRFNKACLPSRAGEGN
jgi:HAE1 family hydrophobic/amphiphilic exporter-1